MGYTDRLRASWLESRDADDYFEALAEARAGYGDDEDTMRLEPAPAEVLAATDAEDVDEIFNDDIPF